MGGTQATGRDRIQDRDEDIISEKQGLEGQSHPLILGAGLMKASIGNVNTGSVTGGSSSFFSHFYQGCMSLDNLLVFDRSFIRC